jgi:hypothetical protein
MKARTKRKMIKKNKSDKKFNAQGNFNNKNILTSPGSASSVAMYSSNHSLIPPNATLTSATDFLAPPATFARMFRTSNFVS